MGHRDLGCLVSGWNRVLTRKEMRFYPHSRLEALLEHHAAASRGSERVKEEAVWSRGASGDKGLTISPGIAVNQDEGWGQENLSQRLLIFGNTTKGQES